MYGWVKGMEISIPLQNCKKLYLNKSVTKDIQGNCLTPGPQLLNV